MKGFIVHINVYGLLNLQRIFVKLHKSKLFLRVTLWVVNIFMGVVMVRHLSFVSTITKVISMDRMMGRDATHGTLFTNVSKFTRLAIGPVRKCTMYLGPKKEYFSFVLFFLPSSSLGQFLQPLHPLSTI